MNGIRALLRKLVFITARRVSLEESHPQIRRNTLPHSHHTLRDFLVTRNMITSVCVLSHSVCDNLSQQPRMTKTLSMLSARVCETGTKY